MKITKKLLEQTIKEVFGELSPPRPIGRDRLERIAAKEAAEREAAAAEPELTPDPAEQDPAYFYSGAGAKGPKKVGTVFGGRVGDPYQYMEVSPGNFQARRGTKGEWKAIKDAGSIASIKSVQAGGESHWKPEDSASTGESSQERSMRLARERGVHPQQPGHAAHRAKFKAAEKEAAVSELQPGDQGYAYDVDTGLLPDETEEDLYPSYDLGETYKRWGELIK